MMSIKNRVENQTDLVGACRIVLNPVCLPEKLSIFVELVEWIVDCDLNASKQTPDKYNFENPKANPRT